MNILHVITGLQKAAGTSVFCGEVCNGLVAAGHDVTIAVIDPTRADCYPIDPRIKLVAISSILDNSTRSTRLEYDLIHIHALWSPILHKVSNWAHKNKMPVVWSPHGMLTPWAMNNKKWKKWLAWWLYQRMDLLRADMLHATAESEVEDMRRMGLNNKVMVAPLGVKVNGRVERVEHADGRKVLLFVSRVQRKKGLVNLAQAWARLSRDVKAGWKVRIVGPDQERHSQEVRAECERLGVIDDWEFAGPKYGDNLQHEYANANLFVLPSFSENFGSVVIEALSYGVPVITTKGTPWRDLEDYKCGRWIDIGIEPLVIALKEIILLSDGNRYEMGDRGRRLVGEKYTWPAIVKKLIEEYEEIMI